MSERRENLSWVVGVLVSGVVHIGAGVGAARYGTFVIDQTGADGPSGAPIELLPPPDEPPLAGVVPPPPPPLELPPPAEPPPSERVMRLGIRESSQDTDAWLGFNEPNPHSGAMSTLDQAQLSLEPGDAGVPGDAANASGGPAAGAEQPQQESMPPMPAQLVAVEPVKAPTVEPQVESPAPAPMPETMLPSGDPVPGEERGEKVERPREQSPTAPTSEPPRDGNAPESTVVGDAMRDAAPAPVDALKSPDGEALGTIETRADPLLPAAAPEGVAPVNPPAVGAAPAAQPEVTTPASVPSIAQSPAVPAGAPVSVPATTSGSAGSAKATPGNKSDRESDAASKKGPIEVRPGKPAAGQGLEIQTVRPQWSITVRLTSVPKNPMVRIVFGHDGKVKNAAFLLGQDTGSAEVDGPLLDAIYRWTAKGKAIDQLPKNDPKAGVPLIMRVVLRN